MKKQLAIFSYAMLSTTLLSIVVTLPFQGVRALSVDGVITNDTVWTLANSPYVVISDVTIGSGVTLTIEQGVEVRFNRGFSLIINGSLHAVGNDVNSIAFTSNENEPVAGDWDGIKFYGDENSTLTMSFCVLQYAKDGITIESLGRAVIEESTVINNSISGIHANGITNLLIQYNTIKLNVNGISTSGVTSSGLKIMDNIISNNENGIYIYVYGDNSRIHNITIVGNTFKENTNGICLHSSARPGLKANAYIKDVTISSNLMESGKYGIYLLAEGWGKPGLLGGGAFIYNSMISDNTISFSEYAIYINSTSNWYSWISSLTISKNIIHSSGIGILLHAFRTPQPPFQEVPFDVALGSNTISANGKGVSVLGDVRANFTGNSLSYNSYGIYLVSSVPSENVARNNDIYRNTAYGIYVVQDASIKAGYNYWGASSGPFHETLHLSGEGDHVNGNGENLVFAPFSTRPFGLINNAPFAMLQVGKTAVAVNQTVIFDGSESYDDSSILKYFLEFGDGATLHSYSGVSKHRYASQGMYNASLVVMDDLGVNSTNTAIETIVVFLPSLVVYVILNPLSVVSQGKVLVMVIVSDGETSVPGAFVQLSSDIGGNFESPSGYTDSDGDFESIFSAPSVSEPLNMRITATASKENYNGGSDEGYLSVLTPPSGVTRLDSAWIWFLAVATVIMVAVLAFVKKRQKS